MDLFVSSAMEADSSLPSFFEMFMTQQVSLNLKPAVRHAHSALAARWPSLDCISPWFEEAYLALTMLIEARVLANQSCLLSESFYGLRRCRYKPIKNKGLPPLPQEAAQSSPADDAHEEFERNGAGYGPGQRLRVRDRRKALLAATMLPYLFAKLDAGHERHVASRARDHQPSGRVRSPENAAETGSTGRDRGRAGIGATSLGTAGRRAGTTARRRLMALRSMFFQVYPLLRASYEGSCLIYHWLYLFRRSAFYSPALRMTHMVVRRATLEDLQEDEEEASAMAMAAVAVADASGMNSAINTASSSGAMSVGGGRSSSSSSNSLGDRVARYGKVLLVAAVVGFKIVEWWTRVESQEGSSWRRAQLPPPPPPPQPPLPASGGCGVPIDPAACPACGALRVNPALCTVSGFVFCYLCLTRHVREHGECPVTGLACCERDVVRLFDDDERPEEGTGGRSKA